MADFAGFVGPAYKAPSVYQDAQECINWYVEIDPTKEDGARGKNALYPTPGLIQQIQLNIAEVRGMYSKAGGNTLYIVCGSTLYSVNSSLVATSIGSLASSSGQVSMNEQTASNGSTLALFISDGANRYVYTYSTSALATVRDGGFTGAGKVDYVDGFVVYNNPGTNQWGCTSFEATSSQALSYAIKASAADNIVTLITDHREVFLLGEKTTEVWVNVGAFPFPFDIVPGTSIQHGCAAKYSVAKLAESIAWLSQDTRGQAIVINLAGYQPKRISTHAVENDIGSGVINDAIAYTYQQGGHEFYVLTFPTQDKTWVYDLSTQEWHKRASRDSMNVLHRHWSNCHAVFQGLSLVGDYANGKIYALDRNTYTDNGTAIQRLRRTPHMTDGLNRVFYEHLQVQFAPGVGLVTGQGSAPQIMLRWSDDGGSTWSSYYFLPIGKIGEFKNRAIKRKMGWARDRVYEVSITDPVNAVLVSAELIASKGDS